MQTLRLFSIGLRAKNTNPQTLANDGRDNNKEQFYWINGKENIQKLFEGDAFAAKIWFGLMYQSAINKEGDNIVLADNSLREKINYCSDNQANFYKAREYVTALYGKINRVQENYAQFKPEKEKSLAKENWQNIVSCYESVIDLMEHAPKIIELFDNNAAMTQNWYQGMALARALPTLKAEVEARKYHAAIQHFAPLFKALDMREKFIDNTKNITIGHAVLYESKDKKNPIRRFVDIEEAQGKYADTYLVADVFIKNLYAPKLSEKSKKDATLSQEFIKPDYHWIDVFVKYGTFVASIALAENSDEVAAILQTSTLPSGSTLRKSKGVNVMINSYFSFIFSNYYNKNGDYGNLKNGFEISAPVGVSFNFGAH